MNLLRRENFDFDFSLKFALEKRHKTRFCLQIHHADASWCLATSFEVNSELPCWRWRMKFFQGPMPTAGRDVNCFSAWSEVKSDAKEVLLHLIDELMTIIADSNLKCASVGGLLRTFHRHRQSCERKCFALNTFSREMNRDLSPRKSKPDRRPDYVCSMSLFRDCFSSKQHTSSMMSSTGMDTSK